MTDHPTIRTRAFEVALKPGGIVHAVCVIESADLTLDDAIQGIDAIKTLAQGAELVGYLFDPRGVRSVAKENRVYGTAEICRLFKRAAIIHRSAVVGAIMNFILRINRPTIPMRVFATEQEALDWLQSR